MKNKIISKSDFVAKIHDGASIMIGGFMNIGTPEGIIDEIVKTDVKDLTIICNDAGLPGVGVGKLVDAGKVKKLIASHIGLNPTVGQKMAAEEIIVELRPQGTLAEQIRAGGAGLGGILTPTGIGTLVQENKKVIQVDGVDYLLEKPLKADFALILGHVVDEKGNTVYNKTTRNFNPLMATACETVVVEARSIVEIGKLDPDHVVTQHIFIDYIVKGELA
ncbi:branched-chain amino acid dehydrogenase [Candidatus Izimaplasma bacterium ZiA1]|uniref:CoA transferase subunit A n=1 Tax=Candidatus Izimoplasma sp. ZiA1 TaxID=2024899 RepID=UPI000BAA3F2A|nr:branched-chain amino acid dehydrogenase [Candidatus Izimaplasma bacterium ZiA1]